MFVAFDNHTCIILQTHHAYAAKLITGYVKGACILLGQVQNIETSVWHSDLDAILA